MQALHYLFTAFVTLLVVVDPLGLVPIFVGLTHGYGLKSRRAVLAKAVRVAFGVALFFLVAGRALLTYLGVSVHAFAISGGILLFATAVPMLFGNRPALQTVAVHERAAAAGDPAIFPLAMPLLSGPGTIATILLLSSQADSVHLALLTVATAAAFLATWMMLHFGERVMLSLREGLVHVITRVLGIVLAALAVQYVLNGISDYSEQLARRVVQSAEKPAGRP